MVTEFNKAKLKFMEELLEASTKALEKEKQAEKDLEREMKANGAIKSSQWYGWAQKASGHTNGLLEAIEIINGIEE